MLELDAREILVGVTGGIAAYKAATLVSLLGKAGAGVSVVMTEAATHFVTPKTFEALTNRPVRWETFGPDHYPHLSVARKADLFCIAPATANFIGKAANGIADDLLSTIYLAFDGPVLVAPTMNVIMWQHPAVQRNVKQLRTDGVTLIGPEAGQLACGETGEGRMSEPEAIFGEIKKMAKACVKFKNDSDR